MVGMPTSGPAKVGPSRSTEIISLLRQLDIRYRAYGSLASAVKNINRCLIHIQLSRPTREMCAFGIQHPVSQQLFT